jgi:hypothetical protein
MSNDAASRCRARFAGIRALFARSRRVSPRRVGWPRGTCPFFKAYWPT